MIPPCPRCRRVGRCRNHPYCFGGRRWPRPGGRPLTTGLWPAWVRRALRGRAYDTRGPLGRPVNRGLVGLRVGRLNAAVREEMTRTFGPVAAVWNHFEHPELIPDGRGGEAVAIEVYVSSRAGTFVWMLNAFAVAVRLRCEVRFRPLPASESARNLEIVFSEPPGGDPPPRRVHRFPCVRRLP